MSITKSTFNALIDAAEKVIDTTVSAGEEAVGGAGDVANAAGNVTVAGLREINDLKSKLLARLRNLADKVDENAPLP